MGLADENRAHADRANADLDEVHNFYDHTKGVWRVFQLSVQEGRKFTFTSSVTNAEVDQDHVLGLTQHYTTEFLASFTFQRFVAVFETFTFSFLRSILLSYPQRLSEKEIKFRVVLSVPDLTALIGRVVDHELNQLKYEKPSDWFAYLEGIAKLGSPGPAEIARISEIKAARDILEHNQGIANAVYITKAGKEARYREGGKIVIADAYHRSSWELLKKAVRDMAAAGMSKYA
jgi:hypothetical protein